jgi:hypothetical protein
VATLSNLVDRVRIELGDIARSFVTSFVADGTTNRFRLHYAPLDGAGIRVFKNNVDISDDCSVEESSGLLVTDTLPADGDDFVVSGNYFRYFTASEMNQIVETAVLQHSASRTDSSGRKLDIDTLPPLEEYPVAIYAATMALYTLATDAAFDIDIQGPDGVTIPRSERYRQLMQMVETRQAQYKELCSLLGIGMYSIEVFNFRRISKTTNRYVPVYKPLEVDDRSFPQRVDLPATTYGDKPSPWPTDGGELIAYQGRSFATSIDLEDTNFAGYQFVARLLPQRGSTYVRQNFTLAVSTTGIGTVTAAERTAGSTVVTITTSAAHGIADASEIVITNVSDELNGTWTVESVPSTTTLTITTEATTALALTELGGVVETTANKDYTFTIGLSKDQTLYLANRTYWSIATIDPVDEQPYEIRGGNFLTERVRTAVL